MSTFASQFLRSKGCRWITIGWTGFIAENLILSENRDLIISWQGDQNYHLLYNTLSSLACGTMLFGYVRYGRGQDAVQGWIRRSNISIVGGGLLQAIGLAGISQLAPAFQSPFTVTESQSSQVTTAPTASSSFTLRCPMDFRPKDIPQDGIYGMERISRHATFWSFGAFMLGHSLTTIFLPEIILGSFPVIFAMIGGAHQDSRHRRGMGGNLSPDKDKKTSNIPFAAFLMGNQQWQDLHKEIKWTNASLAALPPLIWTLRRILRK